MTHAVFTSKRVHEIPDWAILRRQPIEQADDEQAMLASLGMPCQPEWFAVKYGEFKTVVSWDHRVATEVKCLR
jgi:hypothetical protein